MAMTYRVFKEIRKGVVAHTAASKELATNVWSREGLGMGTEEFWPAATKVIVSVPETDKKQIHGQIKLNALLIHFVGNARLSMPW